MDHSTLPPELLILLASKLSIKSYKSNSSSQILNSCNIFHSDTDTKQYYFPKKII